MNPIFLKLIEKGADITEEALKYANQDIIKDLLNEIRSQVKSNLTINDL